MTRVIIVDYHVAIRKMLGVFLHRETGYEVVGETGSGLEAVRLCAGLRPDLVILDLMLMELSGPEVLSRIREQTPATRVLVYSGSQNLAAIRRCLQAGPDGFVEKFDDITNLRKGLRAVVAGRKFFTALPTALFRKQYNEKIDLAKREVEVLQLIAKGRSNFAIFTISEMELLQFIVKGQPNISLRRRKGGPL